MPQFKRVDENGNPVFNRVDETGKPVAATVKPDPNAAIKAQQAAKYPTAAEMGVTDNRTPAQVARDQALQAVYGAAGLVPGMIASVPGMVKTGVGVLQDMVNPAVGIQGKSSQRGQQGISDTAAGMLGMGTTPARGLAALAGANTAPTPQEWEQHAQASGANLAAVALPKVAGKVKESMASKTRAAAKFDKVMAAAKDVPINTAEAEAVLSRAQELRARGSTMPKVLNDFAKNRRNATGNFMGQPVTEPMTYAAGRDFASNAGAMSTREITAMNAKMQAQITKFGEAMKNANREAAVRAGMGDVYDAAMKEYAKAASREAKRQILTKHLVKWGGPAIFGAGLVKLYSDLSD